MQRIPLLLRRLKRKLIFILIKVPFIKPFYETRSTSAPITLKILFYQFVLRKNVAYWPIHPHSLVTGIEFIKIGIGTAPGISFGNYIFATEEGPISIGDYTIIAPNVCIAGVNHNPYDLRHYASKGGIIIGSYCWISMNCSIMSGVKLGDHVTVAANSVVTKSFEEGHCIIGGNPAKVIKRLNRDQCKKYKNQYEYYGYIKKDKFERSLLN